MQRLITVGRACALALAVTGGAGALAATTTLLPSADAYVRAGSYSQQNFGGDSELVVREAASDDLDDTLDYSAVAETITAVLREGKFCLIETAAERVAGRLLADFALSWLRLELRKPITTGGYTAVITIERTHEAADR